VGGGGGGGGGGAFRRDTGGGGRLLVGSDVVAEWWGVSPRSDSRFRVNPILAVWLGVVERARRMGDVPAVGRQRLKLRRKGVTEGRVKGALQLLMNRYG